MRPGAARVMQIRFGVLRLGIVGSFSKPWFEVLFDGGVMHRMRGRELSRSLIFVPSDFYDPHLYYYDFGDLHNGCDKERILGGRYTHLDAMRQRHVHEAGKSAALTVEHGRAIMHVHVSVRLDLPWHLH